MKSEILLCAIIAIGSAATSSHAAISAQVTQDVSLPGIVQNIYTVNTDSDLTGAVVFVELTAGTLYNPNPLVPGLETFQQSPGDTFVTMDNNPQTGIAGAAGDLGHNNLLNPGAAEFGPTVLGVSWFSPGADTNDIGPAIAIGTFSFTDNALGTWQLLVLNANNEIAITSGTITNGFMPIPEPTSLGLLSLGGLALLRRKR